jgi:hypothetical protein
MVVEAGSVVGSYESRGPGIVESQGASSLSLPGDDEMNLKVVFTVNYIYAFLFGAGFMFLPEFCSSLIGFELAGDASLIARCMGIFVLCTGLLTFFCRDAEESRARRAILLSLFILYILLVLMKALLNTLWGFSLSGMFVGLYFFHFALIASYGYHLFGGPRETTA